jgi:hypothetical protein
MGSHHETWGRTAWPELLDSVVSRLPGSCGKRRTVTLLVLAPLLRSDVDSLLWTIVATVCVAGSLFVVLLTTILHETCHQLGHRRHLLSQCCLLLG